MTARSKTMWIKRNEDQWTTIINLDEYRIVRRLSDLSNRHVYDVHRNGSFIGDAFTLKDAKNHALYWSTINP